jgi:hypothetical protein
VAADEAIFAAEGVANGIGNGQGVTPIPTRVEMVAATTDNRNLAGA